VSERERETKRVCVCVKEIKRDGKAEINGDSWKRPELRVHAYTG
jgi:hypothetical protein